MTLFSTLTWLAAGAAAGAAHSFALWRATHRTAKWTAAPPRLFAVGVVLAAAALMGGIFPAAAGWMFTFPAATIFLYWRSM